MRCMWVLIVDGLTPRRPAIAGTEGEQAEDLELAAGSKLRGLETGVGPQILEPTPHRGLPAQPDGPTGGVEERSCERQSGCQVPDEGAEVVLPSRGHGIKCPPRATG